MGEGKKGSKKRPRKQSPGKQQQQQSDAASDKKRKVEVKTKKQSFLKGKVFCITAKGDDESDDKAAASEDTMSFENLKELVEQAGGTVSNILHKRVFALVSTQRAARRRTQRVRKALKFNVPSLTPTIYRNASLRTNASRRRILWLRCPMRQSLSSRRAHETRSRIFWLKQSRKHPSPLTWGAAVLAMIQAN